MHLEPTAIDGPSVLVRQRQEDFRGFFSRIFCRDVFETLGLKFHPQQINHSFSTMRSTLRGLHFQYPPHGETKVVSCIVGSVYDVAVDLRPSSPTFLRSVGTVLSEGDARSFIIPEGFAHGFLSLTANTHILYLASAAYDPNSEDGLRFDDPSLDIAWPSAVAVMSNKDASWPSITQRLDTLSRRMSGLTSQ